MFRGAKFKVHRGWVGYVDAGATYSRVGMAERGSRREIYLKKFKSDDFKSLEDLVLHSFNDAGAAPAHVIYALAGPVDRVRRAVKLTNRPGWPEFHLTKFEDATGTRGMLFNDVELSAAGVDGIPQSMLKPVRQGRMVPGARVLALTWSSGTNCALFDGGRTISVEAGYGRSLPSLTEDEANYSEFVARKRLVTYASAEDVLGGRHGLVDAVEWLRALGEKPTDKIAQRFEELRHSGLTGYGPAIDEGVRNGDSFCLRAMKAVGGLYGTFLRQLMVEFEPVGGFYLVGAVNRSAVPLIADPAVSPMLARLADNSLPYAANVAKIHTVLSYDPEVKLRGARTLAHNFADSHVN